MVDKATDDSSLSQNQATLASFGKTFQEKVVQALLMDKSWAEQVVEVFNPSYLDLKYLEFLATRYTTYAQKYKVYPSLSILVTIIKDELKVGSDTLLRDQVIDYLTRVKGNPDPGDLAYVKEKTLDFCRKQALKSAFEQGIDMMEVEKYEQIVEVIKKAVVVGTTPSVGHDFFTDIEARFNRLQRDAIPTGLPQLDEKFIMNGGLGKGELGVVIGGAGAGKSHWLVALGAHAMKLGKNVVHYTLELSESAVGIRYDSHLCEIDSTNVPELKDVVIEKYKNMKGMGRLIIKEYPTSSATVYTLRAHLERLSVRGFIPDMIIIDYADIMRSTRQYDSLRHELKLIYEELRALAGELKVPIWSASQSNKEGTQADIIDMSNMSEAFGKAFVSDVIISISRKTTEKAAGTGRLYMAKNRAGKDGIVWPIKIDTAQSRFVIDGGQQTPGEVTDEHENDIRRHAREQWKKLQSDKSLFPKTELETAGISSSSAAE